MNNRHMYKYFFPILQMFSKLSPSIISAAKHKIVKPTPYLIVAHCAKALSRVYDVFLDFDINADNKISKVYHLFSIL